MKGNPDFVKLAEAYGIPGLRIKRPADAERVIQKALDYNDGPILIHCECEKEDNVFPMIPAGAPITSMITEQPKTKIWKNSNSIFRSIGKSGKTIWYDFNRSNKPRAF